MGEEPDVSLEVELEDSNIPLVHHLSYVFIPLGWFKHSYLRKTKTSRGIHYSLVDRADILAKEIELTFLDFDYFIGYINKYLIKGVNETKAIRDIRSQVV